MGTKHWLVLLFSSENSARYGIFWLPILNGFKKKSLSKFLANFLATAVKSFQWGYGRKIPGYIVFSGTGSTCVVWTVWALYIGIFSAICTGNHLLNNPTIVKTGTNPFLSGRHVIGLGFGRREKVDFIHLFTPGVLDPIDGGRYKNQDLGPT